MEPDQDGAGTVSKSMRAPVKPTKAMVEDHEFRTYPSGTGAGHVCVEEAKAYTTRP